MFAGLGAAERRILLILRPGRPLTVSQAHEALQEYDFRVHRQAMQSLCRKGFVQAVPGPVFGIKHKAVIAGPADSKRAKRPSCGRDVQDAGARLHIETSSFPAIAYSTPCERSRATKRASVRKSA